jgi:hypothetical protein
MYFAGDGFSQLEGGIDTLSEVYLSEFLPKQGFDLIMTNPPYGKSKYGLSEEAFLRRFLKSLKNGTGWGLIVLPTGILENPRSALLRFQLIKEAKVFDVISLPKHAFAPYTLQKTAILIIQKRKQPLTIADGDWSALQNAVSGEDISFYIVDNDGFANSDKRYPTERKKANGEWMHNELNDWIDKNDIKQPSSIFSALIKGQKPKNTYDEFNNPTGKKYERFKITNLFGSSDLKLLPEVHLRRFTELISENEYIANCQAVIDFLSGKVDVKPYENLKEGIKYLLSAPISPNPNYTYLQCSLLDLFEIEKGNQCFTRVLVRRWGWCFCIRSWFRTWRQTLSIFLSVMASWLQSRSRHQFVSVCWWGLPLWRGTFLHG